MPKYRYTGPGPIEILSGGELIKPNDVREFGAEPDWGPWELVDEPAAEEAPASPPDPPAPPLSPQAAAASLPGVSFSPKGM